MHIPRLTALAALLDVTAPDKFNLSTWHCGTAACAVGTAAMHLDFNYQGLHMHCSNRALVPAYDYGDGTAPLKGWDAVEAFFDLSLGQAGDLFSAGAYSSYASKPADVAARIRKFITRNQP